MSEYYDFDEYAFRRNVENSLKTVEKMLEADRRPLLAKEVHHKYENKYELANHMTNISIVAQMNVLERLGFTPQIIQQLAEAKKKTTTLRFQANETCTFLKEQTVDVPDPHAVEVVKEKKSILGNTRFKSSSSTIHKVIKKVKEYHWTVKTHWEITVFSGIEVDKKIILQSRDSSIIIITQSKDAPMEKVENHTPVDLNLSWLLQQIDMENKATTFTIETTTAKTPRRNDQVDASMKFFCSRMNSWLFNVKSHFSRRLQRIISKIHNPAVPPPSHPEQLANQCSAKDLFQPILPLLEETRNGKNEGTDDGDEEKPLVLDGGSDMDHPQSVSTLTLPNTAPNEVVDGQKRECELLSGKDIVELMNAQVQSIDSKLKSLNEVFPPSHQTTLFSIAEATLYLLLDHSERLCLQYQHGIEYLEKMLEEQLIAAIGKRVTNDDLEEFVRYHNAKFLTIPPRPFCHAIGRPNRFPYGVLSIESKKRNNDNTIPIETMVRPVVMSAPLEVPLNAATTLQLTGNAYLHGWMRHRPERGGTNNGSFQLSARARQFSSFLLVIGTMAGPNKLSPKDAIILQNKDEVLIPLLLEEMPSAKEFKDAIESLSPEQQRFAKSFRGMQLESSVFGMAVIQIKPQLEALLGLHEDSLAKEIKLTEDLMELFVTYQVPSDLLSHDGIADGTSLSPNQKVDSVRRNVKAVMDVIEGEKEKQLEKALTEAEARKAAKRTEEAYLGGTTTYSRTVHEPEYEDDEEYRKTKYEQYALPGRSGDPFKLKHIHKPPPPPEVDEPYSLEYFTPDGGVVEYERTGEWSYAADGGFAPEVRPEKEKTEWKPKKYQRQEKKEPEIVDNRKQRTLEAYGGGDIFDQLAREESDATGVGDGMFGPEIREADNKLDQLDGDASPSHQSVDFTSIPKTLDETIEKFDKDGNLHSTKLKSKDTWSRKRQPDLLTKPETKSLFASDVKSESNKAYDLLDAISRSGSLPIAFSDLHVVVCVTHCFEKDVMATVVEDNVNPIEKLEMSTLLLGSAIHGSKPLELIAEESDRIRFQSSFSLMLQAEERVEG